MSAEYEKATLPFRKRINELDVELHNAVHALYNEQNKCSDLRRENEQLKDWVHRLLEYTDMTEADIKTSIEKDKAIADGAKAFKFLMSFAGRL
jgi:hypothetical protein